MEVVVIYCKCCELRFNLDMELSKLEQASREIVSLTQSTSPIWSSLALQDSQENWATVIILHTEKLKRGFVPAGVN